MPSWTSRRPGLVHAQRTVACRVAAARASRPSASAGKEATTTGPRDELAVDLPLRENERVELRLQRRLVYSSIYRGDDQLLVSQHAYGIAVDQAPVLYVQRTEGGDLADAYLGAFEQAWADAAAHGGS